MADDRVRIDLWHPRRADHDGCRAGIARVPRVLHAGPETISGRAGHDGHAPVDVLHDGFEHAAALAFGQARDLARDAEGCHAGDAAVDEQVDHALQAVVVDLAGRIERCRKYGEYARKRIVARHRHFVVSPHWLAV